MTDAPSLFDAPARRTDPAASWEAGKRAGHGLPTTRGTMLVAFHGTHPLTASEAAERLVRDGTIPIARMDSHRRRAGELLDLGLLEEAGVAPSGATTYRLTGPGRMEAAKIIGARAATR